MAKFTSWIFFLVCACNNPASKPNDENANADSVELNALIKKAYQWHASTISKGDFEPKIADPSDSIYTGIDLASHDKIVNSLKRSGFFDKTFIDNYHNIGLSIDHALKTSITKWYVGELPPYAYEADPWCNCQDNPDNYWELLTITDLKVNKNMATFNWTWGENTEYRVKATKYDGAWKISSLEGFELKNYLWD